MAVKTELENFDIVSKPFSEAVLDFFTVLARWKNFLVSFIVVATIVAALIAALSPKWYKATARVFPAEQTNFLSGLDGLSTLAKTLGGGRGIGSLGQFTDQDRYMAILKSETVLQKVIAKFDLVQVYDISSYPREKTMKELLSNVEFEIADEGNITISAYDKDPRRASDIANYFVACLNEANSNLQAQNARGNRQFLEERYKQNKSDLRNAEDALRDFQIKYGVIAMKEQTEASIKAGAEMYVQLAQKEIELNILKRTLAPSNQNILQSEIEVQETQRKIHDMNSGMNGKDDKMKILVPFKQTPELGVQYFRMYREIQIQTKILEFLTPIYEQAKVEEKRNTPSVIVLDWASLPERKAKPKILLYALLAFVISSLFSIFIIFIIEAYRRLRQSYPARVNELLTEAGTGWFQWLRRR